MKVLFFIESLRSGGKERRIIELIKWLKQNSKIDCEIVLTENEIHYNEIFSLDIKIHFIIRKYLKKDPRLFVMFYNICRKSKPDIINVWGNMAAIYATPSKIILKIPMINNQITDAPGNLHFGLLNHKLTFPFSDIIIANSKAGLKSYNAVSNKSKVIYNGFDMKRLDNLINQEEIKKKFDINSKIVICMVASFSDKKDYHTYLNAAIQIISNNNDITFLCVGSGNYSYFQKMIPTEFKNKIKFLGKQNNIESIINICNIGVLSTYTEGISNSIMEYMALGKPVIATEGGGTSELVINGETGYLVKQKSIEQLVNKLNFLINNESFATEMGIKGKERITKEFSMDKMANQFIENYRKALLYI